ncbi:MAG: GTP-binding protein [Pseudomonadota bacterium]
MTPDKLPVTLLTGFLGAGKTTFLNRLVATPGFGRTAVIVNEFGEAGIDGALVAPADETAVEMTVGCLCCTVSGDIRETVSRLLADRAAGDGPAFDRLVVETTGFANPAPVLQLFLSDDEMRRRCALNGVVTLLDAVNAEYALEKFEEAQRQVAVADLIAITKGDLARDPASLGDLADLKADAARRNPNAKICDAADVDAATAFTLGAYDIATKRPDVAGFLRFQSESPAHHHHGPHGHDANQHGDAASAYCFTADAPIALDALDAAISALQASFGADLLRLKGLVDIAGDPCRPLLVHVAGHALGPPRQLDRWPDGVDQTRIVVILGGAMRAEGPRMLQAFLPALKPFGAG